MAAPRVFVSSTCYDLLDVRDRLVAFIKGYGYEPILSDRGDVFYHPDLHTHDSCLREVDNCQLFILIIGGRFGGEYVADTERSIVNAEYMAARKAGIPIFCFIKRGVLSDHLVYQKNKGDENLVNKIVFPSIEKQKYARKIFEFIDDVRNSPAGNSIFDFEYVREIEDKLRLQWAGMYYDFLLTRKLHKQLETATSILDSLSIASDKTQEILKHLYMRVDEDNAPSVIERVNTEAEAKSFFLRVLEAFRIPAILTDSPEDLVAFKEDLSWSDFLQKANFFEDVVFEDPEDPRDAEHVLFPCDDSLISYGMGQALGGAFDSELAGLFDSYKRLSPDRRRAIIAPYTKRMIVRPMD